jgi:hypothetical protein
MTLNRRKFIAISTAASLAIKGLPLLGASISESVGVSASGGEEEGFPRGDYTPFGYLDNPWHTWDTHRSGVLRSLPGIGFGLYYPAGPGGYFDFKHSEVYEAQLALGFQIGGRNFREPEDFAPGQLTAPHHSKNILSYEFEAEGVHVESAFVQADEDTLATRILLSERAGRHQSIRVLASHTYKLGAANWWGRDGLAGEFDASKDSLWIHGFAAGTVFALTGSRRSSAHFLALREEDRKGWIDSESIVADKVSYYPQPLHGALRYDLALEPHSQAEIVVVMTRGANTSLALDHARASVPSVDGKIAEKRAEDATFWNRAPHLTGDWPKCWKHGWVYDFETLRMMVRRSVGLYKHPWDAMQIQAPRNVLGETSIDMWALSYADPASAKAVFLGQFLDAVAANIPCMREDGVMNMVATDGSECGTSISWCFPFFCAAAIYDRTHDIAWLRRLYPGLAALLRWTLANRADAGGFLVGKCSWETGMDTSKRFLIQQPTGGETVEFLRLVELQAAAAQAGGILARFARLVQDDASIQQWKQVQETYAKKTQELWQGDWFHDFDTRSMQLVTTTPADPSQAAPAFCGVATEDQKRRILPTLRGMFEQVCTKEASADGDGSNALNWSSFMLPYLESLWAAGDRALAAEVVAATADRIYKSMDRSTETLRSGTDTYGGLGWPGVSCEIWGCRGAFGGEGYGWGAVMPAHIIRTLMGFRETEIQGQVLICPNLPPSLGSEGKQYGIQGLNYGATRLSLSYTLLSQERLLVDVECSGGIQVRSVYGEGGNALEVKRSPAHWQFEATNQSSYTVQLS